MRSAALGCALILLSISSFGDQSWYSVRQLCGVVVVDKKVLQETSDKVFHSKAKHLPCCKEATQITEGKADKSGGFFLSEETPGQYFIVLQSDKDQLVAPLWLDRPCSDKKCVIDQSLEFDNRKFEVVEHVSNSQRSSVGNVSHYETRSKAT